MRGSLISPDPASPTPLVTQIVDQITQKIHNRTLENGTRLPSLRRLANEHGVSLLTVSNAYNRLVASGLLEARRASGYFVLGPSSPPGPSDLFPPHPVEISVDSDWLLQYAYDGDPDIIRAGCGWLPDDYLFTDGIKNALSRLARKPDAALFAYGNPRGHEGLRDHVRLSLSRQGIRCDLSSIVLTHGASQALELVIRVLTSPGDSVLIEDPGYCNLFPLLQAAGVQIFSIPRLADGPCIETLEHVLASTQPRLFIINTRLHNPTGSSCSAANIHQILNLAEKHNFMIAEDDIFGQMADEKTLSFAHLDQLKRVIYISSFSKTISPGLRVGYMAMPSAILPSLLRLKMASSLTSCSVSESVTAAILSEGRYRHHLTHLKERLTMARKGTLAKMDQTGLIPFLRPEGGMFLWARLPTDTDISTLTAQGLREGIMLAPGSCFRPGQSASPWLRFNAAHANNERVFNFLRKQMNCS